MGPFQPSHSVPAGGLPAWAAPDAQATPAARLDPGLPVSVADRRGGWARIVCSNGWTGWVDERELVPGAAWLAGASQPAAGAAATPTVAMPRVGTAPASSWSASASSAPAPALVVPGPRLVLGLLGAVTAFLSAFLPWERLPPELGLNQQANAFDPPVEFLLRWSSDYSFQPSKLTVGLLVCALAVIAGISIALRPLRVLASLSGLVLLAVPIVYFVRWGKVASDSAIDVSAVDFVGYGTYIAIGAAFLVVVASFFSTIARR